MKKLITLLAVLFTVTAFAQDTKPEQKSAEFTRMLLDEGQHASSLHGSKTGTAENRSQTSEWNHNFSDRSSESERRLKDTTGKRSVRFIDGKHWRL
jgi:hypothetical protein